MTYSISPDQFGKETDHVGPVFSGSASQVTYVHVKSEEKYDCPEGSPLNSITLKYAEVPGHGAPCKIYMNGDSAQRDEFWKAAREVAKDLGHGLCSGKGEGETASFEAIRPENAAQAIRDVLNAFHEKGMLLPEHITQNVLEEGGFIDAEATKAQITGELNRIAGAFEWQIDGARQERESLLTQLNAESDPESSHRYSAVVGAPAVGV